MRFLIVLVQLCSLFFTINAAFAETVNYIYDPLGRLIVSTKGNIATNYTYDSVGNILNVFDSSFSPDPPVINSVIPQALLVGYRASLVINGVNLLTTQSVVSSTGKITVERFSITDNSINIEVVGTAAGVDTLSLVTAYGSTISVPITIVDSVMTFTPQSQVSIPPGTTTDIYAALSPPFNQNVTLAIVSSDPLVAAVPLYITIPANGSASVPVTAYKEGDIYLPARNQPIKQIFVENILAKSSGATSKAVCVAVEAPLQPTLFSSKGVAVNINPLPPAQIFNYAAAVSVVVDRDHYVPVTQTSRAISVAVGTNPNFQSTGVARAVSVAISTH